ncbi:MAG: dTDP-4-dehydrorhamnose 3,5-epimerase [Candidatus Margulisiibacteriota bacterium]|nr:MAG: dTDP-4-dehydrorhamnose 3,5-epimerase [Candidatus Margulisbacteria bacterium GWD2_39_127]OGI02500.1 MAG: dTDP-4-dehydrorhamnose 3,5-epimerase [Candidatus Margulisbacteria bacterium GWF2_38_17]OGI10993.1 MAG: dTDP-4-dehydrorhamnose 3,5-epimerase [Candidatus Margulisbacteria bacterium GWE2_39_32]PZM83187.1 MAG: dTDP-4-dehydrorhamnose 3,5-epimerase [Candidatus Margulisiibacteriota bacterium]HAR62510.1 dTDP-4-dehydrorhamnose 3,5-epimerase [Candidatus Margulisiibacteriota bacterium]
MPFQFSKLSIPDLVLLEPKVFHDSRGYFVETYKESEFLAQGINYSFVQDNRSKSIKGVLRGLHYQLAPKSQGKLVSVIKGRVWDVAVDIRKSSPMFGKWIGIELSEENNRIFFIPPGFAHGFVALTDEVHLQYKCTNEYSGALDRGIIWNDPDLAIDWPVSAPIVSQKDSLLPRLKDAECFE